MSPDRVHRSVKTGLIALAAFAALPACDVEDDGVVEELSLRVTVTNESMPGMLGGVDVGLSPGVWAVHREPGAFFEVGEPASPELETLAEDGDGQALVQAFGNDDAVPRLGLYGVTEVGVSYEDGPIGPGASATVDIIAMSDEYLTLVSMFGQSNDVFVAVDSFPLAELEDPMVVMLDAGTEVNEEPGRGDNQPGTQSEPGAGEPEDGVIAPPDDGFDYPDVGAIVSVTVERL